MAGARVLGRMPYGASSSAKGLLLSSMAHLLAQYCERSRLQCGPSRIRYGSAILVGRRDQVTRRCLCDRNAQLCRRARLHPQDAFHSVAHLPVGNLALIRSRCTREKCAMLFPPQLARKIVSLVSIPLLGRQRRWANTRSVPGQCEDTHLSRDF